MAGNWEGRRIIAKCIIYWYWEIQNIGIAVKISVQSSTRHMAAVHNEVAVFFRIVSSFYFRLIIEDTHWKQVERLHLVVNRTQPNLEADFPGIFSAGTTNPTPAAANVHTELKGGGSEHQ